MSRQTRSRRITTPRSIPPRHSRPRSSLEMSSSVQRRSRGERTWQSWLDSLLVRLPFYRLDSLVQRLPIARSGAARRAAPDQARSLPRRGASPALPGVGLSTRRLQFRLRALDQVLDHPWGPLLLLSLLTSAGLLLVALSFRASVSGIENSDPLYWFGLVMMVAPAAAFLVDPRQPRSRRILAVVLVGMGLYLVKVIHSPAAFTYADELVHAANARQVLESGRLFGENSILVVTPSYPGLPAVTAIVSSLSGLSIFASGLLVIGAARLLITLGLFLVFEKITGSAWVAGFASVFYAANSNYLYWSAQFAYESLALPLAVFVVFTLVMRQQFGPADPQRPVMSAALIGIVAVTVTHHLSSFALTALLAAMALFASLLKSYDRPIRARLWILAGFSAAIVVYWNRVVEPGVYNYLFPVIRRALDAGVSLVSGGEGGRALFESSGTVTTPTWERWVALLSVALILTLTPLGLLNAWRYMRGTALAWVLALAALIYFPLQGLRLTGAGWETANRASEFLYVGLGLMVALALLWPRLRAMRLPLPLIAALIAAVIFLGGVISGWPPALRMARPYLVGDVSLAGAYQSIEPQGVAAARWANAYLGPGNRMAADNSSARLMQAYGRQYALAGQEFGIRDLFVSESIDRGELEIIQRTGIRYLVFARPLSRWDQMLGLYYNPAEGIAESELAFRQPGFADKFDLNPDVARMLDTGYIVLYEIGDIADAAE